MNTAQNLLHIPCDYAAAPALHPQWKTMCMYTRWIHHTNYQCPIYTWLAQGQVSYRDEKASTCYFLYIEYLRSGGESHYQARVFDTLDDALTFQAQGVAKMVLPMISPDQTRKIKISRDRSC